MASSTKYYGMGFFDFGDPLGTDFAGSIEVDRWLFLDKQIFGMMSVFGNGVIEGWTASQVGGFDISISEGHGNINYMSGRTTFPQNLTVPPSSVQYLYAKIVRSTRYSEEVDFILSATENLSDPNFLLLSRIVSGFSNIESIDNSVRRQIRFLDLIQEAIRDHKHRGGANNPSKIDLASEVKGQLSGNHIADFDAEKVTTGTFDLARLPLIHHQDLENVGLLTHPQLDTFVKTIETSNKELFGEIGSANLLQMIIALKFLYDDPDSPFYQSDAVDSTFLNEFTVIPGITPNDRIDFENSTAEVDLTNHYIKGLSGTVGTAFYVRWETRLAWNTMIQDDNVAIAGDTVTLAFSEDESENITIIEDFETNATGGFEHMMITYKDGEWVEGEPNEGSGGSQGGGFSPGGNFRSVFYREFSSNDGEPTNWNGYQEFRTDIFTVSEDHDTVYWFLYDGSHTGDIPSLFEEGADHRIADQTLLASNSSTSSPENYDFELRRINLEGISPNSMDTSDVKGVVVWTDELSSTFSFSLDDLRLSKEVLLPPSGVFKLRYSTSSSVTFSRLEFDKDLPAGTNIRIRARSANGAVLLNRQPYTQYFEGEAQLDLQGTDLELEITLYANSARTAAPTLNSVYVVVITDAEIDGFAINTQSEWERGKPNNIQVESSTLSLEDPVAVDSYYYAAPNKILQIYNNVAPPSHTDGEDVVFATNAPISPNQVFRSLETGSGVSESMFYYPRSVKRLTDKSVVIADTYNDRVLHYADDGTLIEGFGSINYSHSNVFPISACVDKRTGILYVVWSKSIDFRGVSVSSILINYQGRPIPLLTDYDKINGKLSDDLGATDKGQVMEIHLSKANKAIVSAMTTHGARISFSPQTVQEGVDTDSEFYRRISNALGIRLFVGNFWYTSLSSPAVVPVFSPTYADYTDEDTYIFSNAKVGVKTFSYDASKFPDGVESITYNGFNGPSIVEVDLDRSVNKVVWTASSVDFSPFVPGRAERISSSIVVAAGLKTGQSLSEPTGDNGAWDFRNITGDDDEKTRRRKVLSEMFFSGSEPYQSVAKQISTLQDGGADIWTYTTSEGLLITDATIDLEGNMVVAESSLIGQSGRIIKLDNEGNIIFSYGEGLFSIINDVEIQSDGSMIISS